MGHCSLGKSVPLSRLLGGTVSKRNTHPDGVNFALEDSGGEKKLHLTSVAFVKVATCIGSYIENKMKIFVTNGHEIFR